MTAVFLPSIPIEKTREVVIRCLIDHLGEDVGALIKEFEVSAMKRNGFHCSPYSL